MRISAEIGFFPNIRRSFTKFLNCVLPISSIDLIRSKLKSGATIELLFILCSFVDMNGFTGNHLDDGLVPNSKLLQKMSLFSWCCVERAILVNDFLSDSSNSVMILAMSGQHVSQQINDESSRLLSKSVAPLVDLISLLFCLCTWSRAILPNSLFDFWIEKNLS